MKISFKSSFFLIMSVALSFFVYNLVQAVNCEDNRTCLENPIKSNTIPEIFGNGIKISTGIMGSLALLVFIYGGAVWLTSAGNPEKVKKGTSAMVWAVLGMVVIFSSYAIINLVLNGLGVN